MGDRVGKRFDGEAMMSVTVLKIPVICPHCGSEGLTELRTALVACALAHRQPIHLHSRCHDSVWNANDIEIEQIREYLLSIGIAIG